MEESSKLHEETLKIAKSLMESDPALKDWVTEKFPELKESEDERIRKAIIESYKNQHSSNFPTVDGFTREQILAWLEKQGEQKPTWSEEDEKMLLQITQYLISLSEECEVDLNDRLSWLKSLKERYTWKPSEFQLECLRRVIPHQDTETGNELEYVLTELYNNLKKL